MVSNISMPEVTDSVVPYALVSGISTGAVTVTTAPRMRRSLCPKRLRELTEAQLRAQTTRRGKDGSVSAHPTGRPE